MQQRTILFHYLLRSVILGSFSYLIVRLVQEDRLHYYIAPRTELYVKLAALGLFLVAVCQAFIALQSYDAKRREACDCNHPISSSIWKNVAAYSLFLLPLGLGLFTQDTLLGSGMASLKGMNLTSSALVRGADSTIVNPSAIPEPTVQPDESKGAEEAELPVATPSPTPAVDPLQALFPYDTYTELHAKLGMKLYQSDKAVAINEFGFIETLTTLDLYRDNFIGKKIEISGFVYREDTMKDGQFVISRLAMLCCSADTEPYGILAAVPDGNKLADDTWVQATGTIALTHYLGNEVMELKIDELKTIKQPKSPYVYPDDAYFDAMLGKSETGQLP
ncbi:TIGR03943 family putative permease subunit [Paenibacillus gorillae]|uniref:TIGR03943 family putative permease subunit n=1 Tax=Paenibacillus gorillae TaxID=1243662 RepID=UPI0004B8F1B2|nr:TIGR03943 family protein [Paenibacillus gorillae]